MKLTNRKNSIILFMIIFQVLATVIIMIYNFDSEFYNNEDEKKKFNYESFNIKSGTSGYSYEQIIKPVGIDPISVCIGDANNDGQNDIATTNYADDTISILCWNASKGDWDNQITKSVGWAPRRVRIEDANNDGQNDIVSANNRDDTISILCWNASKGDWNEQIIKSVGWAPISVYIGDANNDGQNDIATANGADDTISILLWNSTLEDWDVQFTKTVGDKPSSVHIGDTNNDGQNDIAVSNHGSNDTVSIFCWNASKGDWNEEITKPVGFNPQSICIGDVNDDGFNDIVTADISGGTISTLSWNNTNNDWNEFITKNIGNFPRDVCIGDANNDNKNDIVVANEGDSTISFLYWNTIIRNWDPRFTIEVGYMPRSVYIGDANNDGQNDVVASNNVDNTISILIWYDHTSPIWDEYPMDQTINFSSSFNYDVNASDFSGIDHYWINDTSNFQVDINGIITNTTSLLTGKYWLEIRAYDPYNNSCSVTIKITVRENIMPTWDELPIDQVIEVGSPFFYDVNASDTSGIHHYWINDTINFHVDGDGVIINLNLLLGGNYYLEIRVYDPYNNFCSVKITIVVEDCTSPTWDEQATDQIIQMGSPFNYDINASDLSGIDHYWINDTSNFQVDINGIITNTTFLLTGKYRLEIRAYDPYNNFCLAKITIVVEDPTSSEKNTDLIIPGYNFLLLWVVMCLISIIFYKKILRQIF